MTEMVLVDQVSHSYGGLGRQAEVATIDSLSIQVDRGEVVSIVGPSGSGKSTLLNLLAGFETPKSGRILIDGEGLSAPHPKVGVVFQEDTLFPWMTVFDNVMYGPKMRKAADSQIADKAMSFLREVGLSGFESHYPFQLSGGMKQRAAIARVLVNDSEILLMDEPFGALDALTRLKLQMLLIEIQSSLSKTVIFVTHDIEEALLISHRVIVLSNRPGRIVDTVILDTPHPRGISFVSSPEVAAHKERILALLLENGEEK